jgi:hypothetical protein
MIIILPMVHQIIIKTIMQMAKIMIKIKMIKKIVIKMMIRKIISQKIVTMGNMMN